PREILLDDAAVQNSPDAVGSVSRLARIVSRPGQVPFAHPELQLFLLRLRTRLRLPSCVALTGARHAGQGKENQRDSAISPGQDIVHHYGCIPVCESDTPVRRL